MPNVSPWKRTSYVSIDRIRHAIDEGPYDGVIALSPENVPYFSGFYNMDLRLLPERMHIAVWPKGGEPAFIAVQRRACIRNFRRHAKAKVGGVVCVRLNPHRLTFLRISNPVLRPVQRNVLDP